MDAKKLTAALAEKMQAEQDKYRTWLLSQPPAEILNHTYEYTIRQDILIALEDHDLTAAQARGSAFSRCSTRKDKSPPP